MTIEDLDHDELVGFIYAYETYHRSPKKDPTVSLSIYDFFIGYKKLVANKRKLAGKKKKLAVEEIPAQIAIAFDGAPAIPRLMASTVPANVIVVDLTGNKPTGLPVWSLKSKTKLGKADFAENVMDDLAEYAQHNPALIKKLSKYLYA